LAKPEPKPVIAPTLSSEQSPFTGQKVDDLAVLERRPILIKISNSPMARPQSGLSRADVVVEHLTEGGMTRFTALYHSQDAIRVGSIRSARLIDLELPVIFDALFVYSGAAADVERMIQASDFSDHTLSDWSGDPGFYRLELPGLAWEHSLFTDTTLLWHIAQERGWNKRPDFNAWAFSQPPPPDGSLANTIDIPYHPRYSSVHYEYDAGLKAYRRWVAGEPHVDALTDQQLAADNVVIIYVNHAETLIVEDSLGAHSVQIQLWGEGRMTLFRNGRGYGGIWSRPDRPSPLWLLDNARNPIPLKPGQTWIQLVPTDLNVTAQ